MKKSLKKSIVAAIALAFLSAPAPARAGADTAAIIGAVTAAKNFLGNNMTAVKDFLGNNMLNMQKLLATVMANTTNDLKNIMVSQNAKAVEGQIQMQADIEQKKAETRAEEKFLRMPPGVCESMSASAMASGARGAARGGAKRLSQEIMERNEVMPNKLTASMETVNTHYEKYCGETDSNIFKRCNTSPTMPNADVDIASITDGAGPKGVGSAPAFSKEQSDAAKAYVNNTTNGQPLPLLTPDLEKTVPGRDYLAARYADQAKMSLATKPMAMSIANNEPAKINGVKLGAHIKSIWENMEKNGTVIPEEMRRALANNNDEASYNFFLQTEVDRRFSNPRWYIEMYSAEPEAVAREHAFMSALQLHMTHDLMRQAEMTNLILGGIYAEMIRSPQNTQLLHEKFRSAAGATGNGGR